MNAPSPLHVSSSKARWVTVALAVGGALVLGCYEGQQSAAPPSSFSGFLTGPAPGWIVALVVGCATAVIQWKNSAAEHKSAAADAKHAAIDAKLAVLDRREAEAKRDEA